MVTKYKFIRTIKQPEGHWFVIKKEHQLEGETADHYKYRVVPLMQKESQADHFKMLTIEMWPFQNDHQAHQAALNIKKALNTIVLSRPSGLSFSDSYLPNAVMSNYIDLQMTGKDAQNCFEGLNIYKIVVNEDDGRIVDSVQMEVWGYATVGVPIDRMLKKMCETSALTDEYDYKLTHALEILNSISFETYGLNKLIKLIVVIELMSPSSKDRRRQSKRKCREYLSKIGFSESDICFFGKMYQLRNDILHGDFSKYSELNEENVNRLQQIVKQSVALEMCTK
ncbi:hypothetical protein DPQ33_13080 [Oceanidesulfovibrio indonesiensis]|uniref:Uncharacterized protein n=1 Tax=Oceanidesulfovibrio indonesiensis TaxID=54767 RepID=A0A7M3MDG2_9BACT|nr:hypothetical protein [Oceanidesulfovibrio indonesiensis]TVM16248.1 hypothetical protein DPQ33_13080 [Oceanidesulfovibrio indonesiensis]